MLVTRNTTERPEAVNAGTVSLVGSNKSIIIEKTIELMTNNAIYKKMCEKHNPYGDGKACEKIVSFMKNYKLLICTKKTM